jgi:hypothetical protein
MGEGAESEAAARGAGERGRERGRGGEEEDIALSSARFSLWVVCSWQLPVYAPPVQACRRCCCDVPERHRLHVRGRATGSGSGRGRGENEEEDEDEDGDEDAMGMRMRMRMRINGRGKAMQKKAEDGRRGSSGLQRTACNTALCRARLSPNHAGPGVHSAGRSTWTCGAAWIFHACDKPEGIPGDQPCREHEQEQGRLFWPRRLPPLFV